MDASWLVFFQSWTLHSNRKELTHNVLLWHTKERSISFFFSLFFFFLPFIESIFGEAIQSGIVSKEPVINKCITVTVHSFISHLNAFKWIDALCWCVLTEQICTFWSKNNGILQSDWPDSVKKKKKDSLSVVLSVVLAGIQISGLYKHLRFLLFL